MLVLQHANELGLAEQRRLLEWIREDGGLRRVIATTREPLFPQVEQGRLSELALLRR
jgi:hypothetical protein